MQFYNKNTEKLKKYYEKSSTLDADSDASKFKLLYPESYKYDDYYDNLPEKLSLYGTHELLQSPRERHLTQK